MNLARSIFSLSALLVGVLAATCAAAAPPWQLQQRIALPGAGKWDYAAIDAGHRRLYVTHGSQVQVIDLDTGKIAGAIAGTDGVHGVAFAPELNLGFTSNGRADSVTVFALDSLEVKRQVKVGGRNPDAILYLPAARQLYTFNGSSGDVTVFDAPAMRIVSTIKAGGKPEFAVDDGAGRVYFNIEDNSAIEVIDVAAGKVVAHWPLAGCEEPSGLALDAAHARLFSVCKNKLAVVTDARDGRRVAEFAIGAHPDAVVYDAAAGQVYVSNGDSATLTVARQLTPDSYDVTASVPTAPGAKTMAFDPATGRAYLPAAADGQLQVLVLAPARQ